jgi:hypothetical protein
LSYDERIGFIKDVMASSHLDTNRALLNVHLFAVY